MTSRSETDRCTVRAPAKLNLCLDLLGRRDDGFHELRTVMSTIRLEDTLRIDASDRGNDLITLKASGPAFTADISPGKENLVTRSLEVLRQETGCRRGALVKLFKRIPSRAGLGGGSSDAAAALVAGNRVWGLGLGVLQLSELGARLGSDIPFFIHAIAARLAGRRAEAALCTGRGERVEPFAAPGGAPIVIVKPPDGLSTAVVYAACEEADYLTGHENPSAVVAEALAAGSWRRLADVMRNALQPPAERVSRLVVRMRESFGRLPSLGSQLSGSGAAYFALCRTFGEAQRAASVARAAGNDQIWVTSTG